MSCQKCGRRGREGERQGDTCGDPLPQQFKPKSDEETAADIARFRLGLPSNDIARERCVGALIYPWLSDDFS